MIAIRPKAASAAARRARLPARSGGQQPAGGGAAVRTEKMGKVEIRIPFVTWRDGRPRFFASAVHRELGYRGMDLRHGPDGPWYTLEEAIQWSRAFEAELAAKRRALAEGRTTPRKLARQLRVSREGLLTVGQMLERFQQSPRMAGETVIEGRKKRRPLAANTVRFYRGAIRLVEQLDEGRIWNAAADDITAKTLAGVIDRIEVLHGLAQARAVRAVLSVAWKHGRAEKLVRRNPIPELEHQLPTLEARIRPATVAEAVHLAAGMDALGFPHAADVWLAGIWTGQRQNDLLSLPASRVTAAGFEFTPQKKAKSGERLIIPVSKVMAARLAAAKERRRSWAVEPLALFAWEKRQQPWKADWWRKVFRVLKIAVATGELERDRHGEVTREAGMILGKIDIRARLAAAGLQPMPSLADLRDQDARDTCLSWLPLAGADKWEIAGFSGHAFGKDEKVLRHYVAIPPEFARRGMAKLEAWYEAELGRLEGKSGTGL